jgi:putative addiction module component (TIGR02574 family)
LSCEHFWDTTKDRHEAIKMLNAEHADLLKLSPSERLLLVQDLWDSLNPEDIPLTDWQKAELDRRKAAYQANPASGRSWEEVQRRIIERHEEY